MADELLAVCLGKCQALLSASVLLTANFATTSLSTSLKDSVCSLQGLAVMTTKMAAGEDLQGTPLTTALGDVLIGPRLPSSTTVEQAQEEGV